MSKSNLWVTVATLAAAALSGCVLPSVAELDPEAKNVKVVRESTKPLHCKTIGEVTGTSRHEQEKTAHAGAENELRNQAAKAQANFALIEIERSRRVGTSPYREVFLGGKALHCTTPEMEEAAEAARQKAAQEKAEREAREQEEAERKAAEEKAAKAEAEKNAKSAKADKTKK